MKDFASIDIDSKFVDGTYKFMKGHDKDSNGMTVEELLEGVLPKEDDSSRNNEPGHYSEQDLW